MCTLVQSRAPACTITPRSIDRMFTFAFTVRRLKVGARNLARPQGHPILSYPGLTC